ncbi:hypothetical protein H1Q59_05820 [Holosporaceae bacterium 'Namur']|nr:hypothetical protein [Holosporaceae bacterium 'Namur']
MLKYMVLEYLKNKIVSPQQNSNFSMCVIVLMLLGFISVIIAECYLSYYIYKYAITLLHYSELKASAITAGIFLLQAVILICIGCLKFKKPVKKNWVIEEKDKVKSITSAFIQGFQSR